MTSTRRKVANRNAHQTYIIRRGTKSDEHRKKYKNEVVVVGKEYEKTIDSH